MAANVSKPVVVPGNYTPIFKVDVNVHAPLRDHQVSESEFKVEMLVHSLLLDTFCKQEQMQASGKNEHVKTGASFLNKANLAYCNLQQTLTKYRGVAHNDSFEREPYFRDLFPSIVEYIHTGAAKHEPNSVDSYLKQLSQMNHVLMLATQIHEDIRCGEKPKYLAHQVAVLFQAIQSLPSGIEMLSRHKNNIEENFPTLKATIADLHDFETSLPKEVEEWLLELTDSITGVIHSMPSQLTQEILPLARLFQTG